MTYATSHTYKVEILTTGARCLLIAMMCFGKLDFVSVQGVEDFSKMVAMPMNMFEIRESVTGMISYVAQSKNIKIGHECTQLNLRNWVEELSNNGLIRVDQKDFIPGHIVKQVIHASFASKSHHIISLSYHIILYHIISHHITSYHIISYHIILYRIIHHLIQFHSTTYQGFEVRR